LNADEITIDLHPAHFWFSEAQLGEDTVVEFQERKYVLIEPQGPD
jgi:hypothetical protein